MPPAASMFLKYRLPSGPIAGVSSSLTVIVFAPVVTAQAASVPGLPSFVRSQLAIASFVSIWRRPQAVTKAKDFSVILKVSGQFVTFLAPATRYREGRPGDAATTYTAPAYETGLASNFWPDNKGDEKKPWGAEYFQSVDCPERPGVGLEGKSYVTIRRGRSAVFFAAPPW